MQALVEAGAEGRYAASLFGAQPHRADERERKLCCRVAFVTEAGPGIGRVTALAFAREGAVVVAADLSERGNRETARMIEEAGGRALAVACDVRRTEDVKAALDKTVKTFGRLDIAFNNAGVEQPIMPAADPTEEEWDRIVDIDLRGVFLCVKHEIPLMFEQGGRRRRDARPDRAGLAARQRHPPQADLLRLPRTREGLPAGDHNPVPTHCGAPECCRGATTRDDTYTTRHGTRAVHNSGHFRPGRGVYGVGTGRPWVRGPRCSRSSLGREDRAEVAAGSRICWHNHVKERRMRVISTKTHGAIDYATGAGLLVAPALLGISDEPAAARALKVAGLAATAYSLMTDYEFGLVRVIPMPAHLAMDAASGALLAASPWLFGFAGRGPRYRLPHVVVGLAEVLASLTSKTR